MTFTDRIKNYEIQTALPSEKMKTSRELYVLATLKYLCPEEFSSLEKGETPDLKSTDGLLGIEVTWGGSPSDEIINGESYKFSHAKTYKDKQKCLKKIRAQGGDRNSYSISFPVTTARKDKINIQDIFQKKLKKLDVYREKCQRLGLAIQIDIPLFLLTDKNWESWLSEVNHDGFDFVIIIHWSGIDIYDFKTGEYRSFRTTREEQQSLKIIARLTAEGIISDNDPEWK